VWDTRTPGFGVRINDAVDRERPGKAGKITFVLYHRFPHKHPTRRVIGRYPNLSLEKARNAANEWIDLAGKGIDPAVEEAKRRDAAAREERRRGERTIGALGELFEQLVTNGTERTAHVMVRELRKHFFVPWRDRSIDEITHRDVAAVITAQVMRGKRTAARNLLSYVKRFFRWAAQSYIEHSPCDRLKPKDLVGKAERRQRYLSDDEVRAFWRAARTLPYPYGLLYRLLLLTGLRVTEASGARWSEIELERRQWIIPAERMKKSGGAAKAHLVPLNDAMIELLKSLPRVEGCRYLFTASRTPGALPVRSNSLDRAKKVLDARMARLLRAMARQRGTDPDRIDFELWQTHDLRRTLRTALSQMKVEEVVREACLAHTRRGIAAHYDLYDYADEKRMALEMWAQRLDGIIDPPPARDNVVALGAR
jgi:integrase